MIELSAEDSAYSWSVHLAARHPKRLAQIAAILAAALLASLCVFHSLWLGLPPMLALLFSLSDYVFPVRYTLTESSASARHGLSVLEIQWADVRHAYLADDGIKLSPLRTKNSRFEPLRGVFLRFGDTNKNAVIAAVRQFREQESADE